MARSNCRNTAARRRVSCSRNRKLTWEGTVEDIDVRRTMQKLQGKQVTERKDLLGKKPGNVRIGRPKKNEKGKGFRKFIIIR